MNIVVTGAKGYIGKVLVDQLKNKEGINVIKHDIDTWDIRKPYPEGFTRDVSVVIHLAGLIKVGESVKDPWSYYKTNILGTMNVMDAFPNAKMIFASTGAAFDPQNPYAKSKIICEDMIKAEYNKYTIFRFFNVGGGHPTNPEGLYQATRNAMETGTFTIFGDDYDTPDGTCVRDYVHVDDIAQAMVGAIGVEPAMSDYEPLGSGKSYTVKQYVDKFLEVNGPLFKVEYGPRRPGDAAATEVPFMSKYMVPMKSLEDIVRLP